MKFFIEQGAHIIYRKFSSPPKRKISHQVFIQGFIPRSNVHRNSWNTDFHHLSKHKIDCVGSRETPKTESIRMMLIFYKLRYLVYSLYRVSIRYIYMDKPINAAVWVLCKIKNI